MGLEIVRLHLAYLRPPGAEIDWPVHGFIVKHPRAGALLVDTGVGDNDRIASDWRLVNRSVADALADHDMVPSDVSMVVNTHLHFDHCGQNAVFKHAPFYVQRAELERARVEQRALVHWFDFAGARFELLDGDGEIAPGVRVLATPGHTVGHQSVVVDTEDGEQVLIGDAAYTPALYVKPDRPELPPGQAADREAWRASLKRLHDMSPAHVHFCHHTDVVHGL